VTEEAYGVDIPQNVDGNEAPVTGKAADVLDVPRRTSAA
jgi:hypothetical protein